MKRYCILFIFLLFASFSSFAQDSTLIDGYNDLPWGATVEEVRKKYPNLRVNPSAKVEKDEMFYESVSSSIERYFRFYKGKLYWVRCFYDSDTLSQAQFDKLESTLFEKYTFMGVKELDKEDDDDLDFGYEWYLCPSYPDSNVTLEVKRSTNAFGKKQGQYVLVTYSSYSISKEMYSAGADDLEM